MIRDIELKSEAEQQAEAERQLKFIDEARDLVTGISESLGRPLYSTVVTFGCQMNLDVPTALSCG